MLYAKKCSNPRCNCREFYMKWDGYNIQLRCMDGHYNCNISRKEVYPKMTQYADVEDRTGFDEVSITKQDNIISLNSHNLKNTVNGDISIQKDKRIEEKQVKHKSQRRANNFKQYKLKTGTTDIDYNVIEDVSSSRLNYNDSFLNGLKTFDE